jgi:putative tryptophan/tyrosine transport system substrate-binding protein
MRQVQRRRFLLSASALLAAPFSADAQQARKVYRLGFLTQVEAHWLTDPFDAALRERGWIVGQNIFIERRAPGADTQRAVAMAQELVAQRVDVIVVAGTHMALAARRATINVPIVMLLSGYPVEAGLAASLARPGGNVTGLSTYGGEALFGKFMSLLRELLPSLRELAVIWDYVPRCSGRRKHK